MKVNVRDAMDALNDIINAAMMEDPDKMSDEYKDWLELIAFAYAILNRLDPDFATKEIGGTLHRAECWVLMGKIHDAVVKAFAMSGAHTPTHENQD